MEGVSTCKPEKVLKTEVKGDHSQATRSADNELGLDSPASPLMSLPKEIWSLIFSYVPQQHRISHRLVSKEWRKSVDEFSTVDVNFNADYPGERYLSRVFELRIRSCTFSSLRMPFSPDFRNPLLVKEITFTTHVSARNVLRILSVCTNLESLRFLTLMNSESGFEKDEETTRTFNGLKNLQYLEIGILTFLDRTLSSKDSLTFKAIIGNENVLFPSLRGLNVAYLVKHTEWLEIFQFVSRHSATLKSLNMICPCGERLGCGEQREKHLIPTNLVLPQLESLVVNGASECTCRSDLWLLLDQQKNLRRFESDISRGGLVYLEDLIKRNQDTIKIMKLHEIGNMYSDELDCNLFSKCTNLQELSLFIAGDCGCVIVVNVGNGGGPPQHQLPILNHLEALPNGLRKLTLCGSQILTEEMGKIFSPGRKLEEVTLGRADSVKVKSAGMTLKLLIKMLESLKALKKFRIFLDMICETEVDHRIDYCHELEGVWAQVFSFAKDTLENEAVYFWHGDSYEGDHCFSHRPYIDMNFKDENEKLEFLQKIKELDK